MAIVQPAFGRISGKIGGIVFSTGPGGPYVRAHVKGTDPATPQQQTIRSAGAKLAARWVERLSQASRDTWETYAANVTVPNRWGNPIHLPALAHFLRSNVPRLQVDHNAVIVDRAPVIFNLGEYSEPSIAVTNAVVASATFNVNDDWVSEDNARMLIYASRTQAACTRFFAGGYRLALSQIRGNSITPPTSPRTIVLPFPAVDGNRTFFNARVYRADGRLSAHWKGVALAVIP